MLLGNRGSTCFSGIWRPDQLPICVAGILNLISHLYSIHVKSFRSTCHLATCITQVCEQRMIKWLILPFFFYGLSSFNVLIDLSLKTSVQQLTLSLMSSLICVCVCLYVCVCVYACAENYVSFMSSTKTKFTHEIRRRLFKHKNFLKFSAWNYNNEYHRPQERCRSKLSNNIVMQYE